MTERDPYHIDIIRLLLTKWRYFLGFCALTAILSSIIMLFLPNYYQSTALFYPVNESAFQEWNNSSNREIEYYGNDHDVDRIMSIGNSTSFLYNFIEEQNLKDHYKIDDTTGKGKEKLLKKFEKLFTLQRTNADAIQLSVEDQSPEFAEKLTNAAFIKLRDQVSELNKSSIAAIFKSTSQNAQEIRSKLLNLTEELGAARMKYGIYDTQNQGEALAKMEINQPGNRTTEKINKYNEGVAKVKQLEISQEAYTKQLAEIDAKTSKLKQAIDAETPIFHMIQQPAIPFIKSRPKRSLYVLGSIFVAGFSMLCFFLIMEQWRDRLV
jgi:uncharacterized protein involved in exopolysaccharide biosynthesis